MTTTEAFIAGHICNAYCNREPGLHADVVHLWQDPIYSEGSTQQACEEMVRTHRVRWLGEWVERVEWAPEVQPITVDAWIASLVERGLPSDCMADLKRQRDYILKHGWTYAGAFLVFFRVAHGGAE